MALRDQPYIPLYVQDFMTDEKLNECSAESTGVYIRIMCLMHKSQEYGTILLQQKYQQSDSNIKNFAYKLQRHMPYDVATIERALHELVNEEVLHLDNNVLSQKRMVKDGELSLIRANAGKKGGQQTSARAKQAAKSVANISANNVAKSVASTEDEYAYEIEVESEVKGTKKRMTYDDPGFQAFWSAYPNKKAKLAALKAFTKLKPDTALLDEMLKAIATQKQWAQWQKDNGQYIPMPTTWLNQRRWEDELPQENHGLPPGYSAVLSD